MFMFLLAQTAPLQQNQASIASYAQIFMIIAIFAIFYLVLILPENKRRKKLQKEIDEMKQNDKVVLTSGIIGTVEFIGDKTIYIKSLDSKFEVSKEAIAAVIKNK